MLAVVTSGMRKKLAVFIFGTPGAGKGTQANLLAWTKGFYHFDSGKELRGILHDPARQDEEIVKQERKLNDGGILNTPSWVLGIFKEATERIAKAGMSIVYSGSPRTIYEAFGEGDTVGLIPYTQELYGAENIHVIYLELKPEIASSRNTIRRTCTVCGTPMLGEATLTSCPICQGELKTRTDDNPETYKTRYHEYTTRTLPIFDEFKKRNIAITTINADQKPPVIFAEILKTLGY